MMGGQTDLPADQNSAPHFIRRAPADWTASDAIVSEPRTIVKPPGGVVKADSPLTSGDLEARRLPKNNSQFF
jgi:hypothetical protein